MKSEIEYVYNKLKQLRFDFKESDRKLFPNEYTFDYGLGRYVRVDGNDLYISKDTFKPLEEELEYADKMHSLEEQIGCSFMIICRAIKEGIWSSEYWYCEKEENQNKIRYIFPELTILENEWGFDCGDHCYYFVLLKDYKKTWWLKEDKSE